MLDELNQAYKKLFDKDPENLKNWEIAKAVIENWNVPVLGEDLAKQVIFKVVNHVNFPSKEMTNEIVLKTERFAPELFGDELSDEPHMAELERLEGIYYERKRRDNNNEISKLI